MLGKSTLFNRIAGERISIVEDVEGVTRDRIYATGEWLNRSFSMIDTGGIDDVDAPFMEQIKHQAEIAMEEADVIVFVVSGKEGITDADEYVAANFIKPTNQLSLRLTRWTTLKCEMISMISMLSVWVNHCLSHLSWYRYRGCARRHRRKSPMNMKKKIQMSLSLA